MYIEDQISTTDPVFIAIERFSSLSSDVDNRTLTTHIQTLILSRSKIALRVRTSNAGDVAAFLSVSCRGDVRLSFNRLVLSVTTHLTRVEGRNCPPIRCYSN